MGHSNPKAKGAEWERTVCKRLSLWVSDMVREDIFWRSAMSGGRATFQTRKNRGTEDKFTNQAGDISSISPEGAPLINKFFIECKNLASLKLDGIVYGTAGELRKYWDEPLKQSAKYNKLPLVIAKEKFRNPIVMTTREGLDLLNRSSSSPLVVRAIFPVHGIYIIDFKEFLIKVNYKDLCKLIQPN